MKKALIFTLVSFLLFETAVLFADSVPTKGRVTSAVINGLIIRKKPTTNSARTGVKMYAGTEFDISKVSGKWYKTTKGGVTGWVYSGKYVEIIAEKEDDDDVSERKNKIPRLTKSIKTVKVKAIKPGNKNYTGNFVKNTEKSSNDRKSFHRRDSQSDVAITGHAQPQTPPTVDFNSGDGVDNGDGEAKWHQPEDSDNAGDNPTKSADGQNNGVEAKNGKGGDGDKTQNTK